MKIEAIDIVIAGIALLMLASYYKLQNVDFLLVFAVLVVAEVVVWFLERRKHKVVSQ